MTKLEEIAVGSIEISEEKVGRYQAAKDAVSNYLVDFSAGTMFYTPLMASGEYFIAGMEPEEVLKSRIAAMGIHAICFRPIGKLRNAAANYFNLDENSTSYKKWASDVGSTLAIQLPTYSLALMTSGASLKEGLVALGVGATVTAVSGRAFGKWMDTWRGIWGKERALKKTKE